MSNFKHSNADIIVAIFGVLAPIVAWLAFWGVVIYIAVHFIRKAW